MSVYLWILDLALSLYSVGMVLCCFAMRHPKGLAARAAWVVLPLAVAVHGSGFLLQWHVQKVFPLHTLLGAFSLYALLGFIGALRFAVTAESASVAFSLGAIPYVVLILAHALRFHAVTLKTELPPSFLSIHLFAVMASFAAFSLAAASGMLLLAMEKALKQKRFGLFWESLPPLDALDHETYRFIVIGFYALTLGIAIGAWGAPHVWGTAWYRDRRLVSTLAVWLLYGSYLLARARYGWRGRKLALFSVYGFVLTLVTFMLINMGKYLL